MGRFVSDIGLDISRGAMGRRVEASGSYWHGRLCADPRCHPQRGPYARHVPRARRDPHRPLPHRASAWPGRHGYVYLARDLKLDREVALKVLRPELGAVLGAERFLAEMKITARLDHPHILTLIDSGRRTGCCTMCCRTCAASRCATSSNREQQLGIEEALDDHEAGRRARSTTRTARASCIATSSRRTSCSRKARRCSPTSASRSP